MTRVIIQPPVYRPSAVVTSTGRRVLENPLRVKDGRYEMDLEGLRLWPAGARPRCFSSAPPQSGGPGVDPGELQAAADICAANGVTLFSDEIHADFVHPGSIHTFRGLDGPCRPGVHRGNLRQQELQSGRTGDRQHHHIRPGPPRQADGQGGGLLQGVHQLLRPGGYPAAYEQGAWLEALLEVIRGNYEYCKNFMAEKFPP